MTGRRRKRLIAAVTVLLLLAGVGYWFTRPRVDPRFFGTWTAYAAQGAVPNAVPSGPSLGTVTYWPNGTATNQSSMGLQQNHWSIDHEGRFKFTPSVHDSQSAMT